MPITSQLGTANSQLANMQLSGLGANTVYIRSLSDSITLSDTFEGHSLTQTFSDTLTLTDVMRGFKNALEDTLSFSETLTTQNHVSANMSDTLTFSEVLFRTVIVSMSDTLTLSDTCVGHDWKLGSLADTLSLTETLLREFIGNRTIIDPLDLLDTFHTLFVRLRSFSDTVGFTEALNGVASKLFVDSVSFSEVLTAFVAKVFRDTIDMGDLITCNAIFHRSEADTMTLFDSLSTHNVIRRTFTETVVFSDSMVGVSVKKLIPDTLPFSETIVGNRSSPIADTLILTETFGVNKSQNIVSGDILVLSDAFFPNQVTNQHLAEVIEFIELIRGLKAHIAVMSDSLTLVDGVLREVHRVTLADSLTLSDTLTYHKNSTRTLPDSLTLNETLGLLKVSKVGWTDLLIMAEGFSIKVKSVGPPISGGSISQVVPVIPTPPMGSPPSTGTYSPSPVWQGVTAVLPQVVLIGKARSIVLPPPEFNDYDAGQGKIAVQRSMTGRFRVYSKRAEREKRNWRFTIPRYKAIEFREFLLAEIDNEINVIDWYGDYWNVHILSDSVDFTESRHWEPCGNATDVTIEIVGNRYA